MLLVKSKIVGTSISKSKFHLHISTKLVLFFLIASLIPIIVLGTVSIDLSKSSLEKENFVAVNAQADLTKRSVEVFFQERTSDALVTSQIEIFKKEMGTFDTFYNEPTNPQYIESDAKLDERLKLIRESYGYDNIMLTNSDGTIVFVSKNDRKETYLGNSFLQIDPDTFNEGKNGVYLSKVIEDVGGDGLPELYISAPIFDNDSNLIGVLIFDIPFKRLLDQAAPTWYVGETGETLIVNRLGDKVVALHSLRFQEEARFEEGIQIGDILAGPAQQASSGNDGTGFSIDYRGEEILAAWRYVESIDWGLVSKIDSAEALAPIEQLEQDITVLAIVFSIGVGFFGISAARSFSKPILELGNMASEISKGNFDANVDIQSSDEIGHLSKMMNVTAEKLKLSEKQKNEFAAMITHELKTPLVPIQGYCEMLKNPKFGALNDDQKDAVNEILTNSKQLLQLIQNVLNAQKLEAQGMKYNMETFGVDEYIVNVMKTLEHYTKEKNIEFTESVEKGLSIKCDKSRLMEIFNNLVANAVDFTPADTGKIHIDGKSDGNIVQFSVKDNGIGIPKEKQAGMFKKFFQVDTSATRKHGGSGLGLAICMGYIKDFGGKMWLESEEGKGAAFLFTIPKSE